MKHHEFMERKRCRRCKKEMFFPQGSAIWRYRDGSKLYCSYHCMQEYRREHPNDSQIAHGRRRHLLSLDIIMRYFGITTDNLAQALGISAVSAEDLRQCIRYAKGMEIDTLCDLFGCAEYDLVSAEKPEKERMRLWEVQWEHFDAEDEK